MKIRVTPVVFVLVACLAVYTDIISLTHSVLVLNGFSI